MLSLPMRTIVILGALLLGAVTLAEDSPLALAFFVGAAVLAFGYFRNGAVWLASRALRRGDLARMDALLAETRKPDLLSKTQRPYYELMMGLSLRQKGDVAGARSHFETALAGRLRTDKDRSLAHAQLAQIALAMGDLQRAEEHIEKARDGAAGTPMAAYIDDLEVKLQGRGGDAGTDSGAGSVPGV